VHYPLRRKPETYGFPVNLIKGVCTMKKTVVVMLLVIAALAVFATGVAFAQTPQPAGSGRGPMGGVNGPEGPLHEYMVKAMAGALGISADDFETRLDSGKTAYQIALDLGISADKVPALLSAARVNALDAAVADKVINPDQADWMKSHAAGMGSGNCNGTGQPVGAGVGRGHRWQQSNP
jgi:hypothetical protein